MDLNSLYQFAERNQINVMSFHTPHKKAYCMNGDGIQIIIMDYSKIVSEREEKEILAEEVAHLQNKYLYLYAQQSSYNKITRWTDRKTARRSHSLESQQLLRISNSRMDLQICGVIYN